MNNGKQVLRDVGIDEKLRYVAMVEDGKKVAAQREIASTYGVHRDTARRWLNKVLEDEGLVDYSKMYVKGVSTLYNKDGDVSSRWVKENVDEKARHEALLRAMTKTIEKLQVKDIIEKTCDIGDRNLMVKYPMADAHIGLLAKKSEVGSDWDLEKAQAIYVQSMRMLVDSAPSTEVGLILELGDMTHVADSTGKTRGHGHDLDVSGNLEEIYEASLFVITTMIDLALEKHDKVIFRKTIGNHDGDTSIAIGVFLKRLYSSNERVVIEAGSNLFWSYKFGKTLHFSTHGHTVKQRDLPEIVAHDCKDVWSDTDYRYADTGHVHHQQVLETRTVICECHNSLVPGDNYNYGSGYRSGRKMKAITYDKDYGEVARTVVNIAMVEKELSNG